LESSGNPFFASEYPLFASATRQLAAWGEIHGIMGPNKDISGNLTKCMMT
jgi:hypothetical protein